MTLATRDETAWMTRSECARRLEDWDNAPDLMKLRICRYSCPVREACLAWSVTMEADPTTRIGGVVGGTLPEGRARLAAILDRADRTGRAGGW